MGRQLRAGFGSKPYTLRGAPGRYNYYGAPTLRKGQGAGGGSLVHLQSFTITGTGFGTKSRALGSAVRDVGAAALNTLDSQWSGGWPSSGTANYQLQNQNLNAVPSGSTVGAPHPYVTRGMAGCHGDNLSADDGWNVGPWINIPQANVPAFPWAFVMDWWYRFDPNWQFGTNTGGTNDDNTKLTDFGIGNGVDNSLGWVVQFGVPGPTAGTQADHQLIMGDYSLNTVEDPDGNGHSHFWLHGLAPAYPANAWIHNRMEVCVTNQTGLAGGGYCWWWDSGALNGLAQKVNYFGRTDNFGTGARHISPSWFARSFSPTNYRYLADLKIDWTASGATRCAQVLVGDAPTFASCSTLIPSEPTAWGNTAITFTFWKGNLQGGTLGYPYVLTESGAIVTPDQASVPISSSP